MKIHNLIALTLVVLCLPIQASERDTKKVIRNFGMIGGGYELNKKCKLLNEKKAAELEKYYKKSSERVRDFLLTAPKEDHDYARAVGQASMKTIEDEKYSPAGQRQKN